MGSIDRRTFLSIIGAAGAAAAITKPDDTANKLIPYVVPPENIRPGVWAHFTTTCRECPAGCGMYARHRDGRVVKAEGNPAHPINRGGLCPRGQSAPQGLYDPDRITQPLQKDKNGKFGTASWSYVFTQIASSLQEDSSNVAVISELQTGTAKDSIKRFLNSYGSNRMLIYEPFNYESIKTAHSNLFGIDGIPRYRMDHCDFLISFSADFLETWISPVEFASQFGKFRSVDNHIPGNFIYIGPRISMTAANADQVLLVPPGEERWVALAMLQVMLDENLVHHDKETISQAVKTFGGDRVWNNVSLTREQVTDLAKAFSSAKNSLAFSSPVAAQNSLQDIELAEATALLNYASGKMNTVADFSRLHAFSTTATENETVNFLKSITEKDILFILNSNIIFTFPEAAQFIKKAKFIIYLTTLPDETAELAHWVLPIDSPLESWGDYEPYTGINTIQQPTMGRIFSTKGQAEVLLSLCKNEKLDSKILLYEKWRQIHATYGSALSFSKFWTSVLRVGFFENAVSPVSIQLKISDLKPFQVSDKNEDTLSLWAWPSIMLYDGRLANRGWMQESPEPVSYAVWGSWADLHPETAKKNHIVQNTIIKVTNKNVSFEIPVRITDQIIPGSVAIMLGQGHTASGLNLAKGVGVNVFSIIRNGGQHIFGSISIEHTKKIESIVVTSPTYDQYNRDILKTVKLSELQKVSFSKDEIIYPLAIEYSPKHDLYPPHQHKKHRWAMVVDLQRCIGCGACAVACYAENNIPVMGKLPVANGREMAWLKVVPYTIPQTGMLAWLPMLCQHCDAAPCEPVCPVYASVHNEEGLNAQIYNRCIGTRYCSNNCPYKVRRFNWFNKKWQKPLNLQLNPEVTVRCRGVMEKCTFCVQRIREVEYQALVEHRAIRDGEIQPACVQSCPTRVYTFGDLLDPEAEVTKKIQCDQRRYQVLKELNTKPAVIYLKKVRI